MKKKFKINKGLYFVDIEKYKSLEDFWKKPNKQNLFTVVYLFLFSIFCLSILSLAMIISSHLNANSIISKLSQLPDVKNPQNAFAITLYSYYSSLIIQLILFVSLLFSIFRCYKEKSFKEISKLATIFVFVKVIIGFGNIVVTFLTNSKQNPFELSYISWTYSADFVIVFIYILIWFFLSRNVSLIRNISRQYYWVLKRQEEFNKQFGEFMQNNSQNPFAPFAASFQQQNNQNNEEINKPNVDEFYTRLNNLSIDELHIIAQKLSISGYKSLKREELIKIIYDIRSTQKRNTKDFEIKTEEDKSKEKENQDKN